jgi:hypothetical protein
MAAVTTAVRKANTLPTSFPSRKYAPTGFAIKLNCQAWLAISWTGGVGDHRISRLAVAGDGVVIPAKNRPSTTPILRLQLRHHLAERSGAPSLTYPKALTTRDGSMNTLPVDRVLRIYDTLANRSERKGSREGLSKYLMERFIAGEKDEHRLTVDGLSYLRAKDREVDSQN